MTDPEPSNPLDAASRAQDAGSGGTEQPNYIARSVTGVLRRTERALSPWMRGVWQSATSLRSATMPVIQPRVDRTSAASRPATTEQPTQRSHSFGAMARTAAFSGSPALTMANRVQRKAEKPGVIQRTAERPAALAMDRFAETVVRRFPPVAARYDLRPLDVSGAVQRSQLPFSGMPAASEPAQSETLALADESADTGYPPISVSPEESIAAQMAARLEAFRQSDWNLSQSPRQVSRKAAQVAAARSGRSTSERPALWRSKVEELGPRAESPVQPEESAPVPPASVEQSARPRETIQRKADEKPPPELAQPDRTQARRAPPAVPSTPPAKPPLVEAQPRGPAVQRETRVDRRDEAEVESAGPRPDLPSISKLLAERFTQARMQWETEPLDDKPSFLKSAPQPSPPESTVQRADESPAQKPASPPPQTSAKSRAVELPAPSLRQDASEVERTPANVEPPQDSEPTPRVAPSEAGEMPLVQRTATPAVRRTPEVLPSESQPEPPSQLREAESPHQPAPGVTQIQGEPEAPVKSSQVPTKSEAEPPPAPPDQSPPSEPVASALPPQPAQPAGPRRIPQAADDLTLRPPQPSAEPVSQTPPQIQRQVAPEAPTSVDTLGTQVEARGPLEPSVEGQTTLPLASPRAMARARSADMTVLTKPPIQRQVGAEYEAELPLEAPKTTPRPTDSRPTQMAAVTQRPTSIVQRSPEKPSPTKRELSRTNLPLAPSVARVAERIQREETSTATASTESTSAESQETPAQSSPINLQDLARRIYPIIKRMLAIERERR